MITKFQDSTSSRRVPKLNIIDFNCTEKQNTNSYQIDLLRIIVLYLLGQLVNMFALDVTENNELLFSKCTDYILTFAG